jgi:hypothetical protein
MHEALRYARARPIFPIVDGSGKVPDESVSEHDARQFRIWHQGPRSCPAEIFDTQKRRHAPVASYLPSPSECSTELGAKDNRRSDG